MKELINHTTEIRAGEHVDIAKLRARLEQELPNVRGELSVEQFPGGHSNLTYLVKAGKREWVMRRPPFGSTVASAHDMSREYRVLSRLHEVFPKAPKPLFYCDDPDVIGAPFYLMKRIDGVIYRAHKPPGFDMTPHRVRDACYAFIETLAELHLVDYESAGLGELYKGPGYLDRQVRGWEKRWAGSKTEDVAEMDRVLPWLKGHQPAEDYAARVIHNDFKFDNLVFDGETGTKLIGVLDWEMATIGDPLSDFAVSLTTWREGGDDPESTVAACFLCSETGALTREELIRIYGRRTGFDLSNLLWYYVLALYKGAVILQQIYYRYHQGLTQDERFAPLGEVAQAMARRAAYAVDSGEI